MNDTLGIQVDEAVVRFGEQQRLVGTLSRPGHRLRASAPVLLLFNAGLIPRIGPHRLNVKLARAFADAGGAAFRFDLSGQGDSAASTSVVGFERQAVLDVRAAMDAVEARMGPSRFVVFGICSGAVLGYQAALEDERIAGCAMFDPYMYPTWRTHLVRMRTVLEQGGARAVARGWIARRLGWGRRGSGDRSRSRDAVDLGLVDPPRAEFAAGLSRLLARGARVITMYSGSALYTYNHASQFDDGFRRYGLAGRVAALYLPTIDHTVTMLDAQRRLIDLVVAWALGRDTPGSGS